MAETLSQSAPEGPPARSRSAPEILIASASEAFASAILLWVLGSVAIGIAGGFAGDMVPSPPPGFAALPSSPGDHAKGHVETWSHAISERAFVFVFAIFFVHSLWSAFRRDRTGLEGRLGRIVSKLRENWFGLIVGNAISAWVAVLVLNIMQNFSPVRIFWQMVSGIILPIVAEIGRFLLGNSNASSLGDWFSWYNANDAKLSFWIIYLGGAFDDLGVPNFKTLARWGWRKWRNRQEKALPVPDSQPK